MNCFVAGMLIWCLGAALAGPPDSQLLESVLTQWEKHGDAVEYEAVTDWARTVREGTAKGDSQVLGRLLTIARTESQNSGSRSAALSVAADVADETGGLAVIGVIDDLVTSRIIQGDLQDETQRARRLRSHDGIVLSFVRYDMERLIDTMRDDTAALAFLSNRYSFPAMGMEMTIGRLAAACDVPADVRSDAAVTMISKKYGVMWPVIEMLDPSGFPPLRELVRAHSSVREFHTAAAAALAYHGDQEILPYLKSLRPAFLAEHRNHETRLLSLIWRIEIQHPPAKLLEYIASPDYMATRDPRSWAVRRARQLGIEPDQIREAILTHEKVATTRLERWEVPELKRLGLELGILRTTDLPDVVIRRSNKTP